MTNPLATEAQKAAEQATLRMERSEPVLAARERIRRKLLAEPVAATGDGRRGLDSVVDKWIRFYTLMQLTQDQPQPTLLWVADNSPRRWFGHFFPGDIVAGDNPDNTNRGTFLDGGSRYEIVGRFGTPKVAQLSFNVAMSDPVGIALGAHLATLTDRQIALEPDGSFRVTIDADPANGRRNHMQVREGLLNLAVRDSRSDWREQATRLELRLIDGPGLPRLGEDERIAQIAGSVEAFIERWSRFKDGFFGVSEPNRVIVPQRRDSEGGWGFLGGGRFKLEVDDALIVTIDAAGSAYTGFQITDPWTQRPETVLRTSSLSISQSLPDADGRYTYVISQQDPGIANWIDPVGMSEGFYQIRWQNVPDGRSPGADEARLVKLDDLAGALPPGVTAADLAYRRKQIRERVRGMALRTAMAESAIVAGSDLD